MPQSTATIAKSVHARADMPETMRRINSSRRAGTGQSDPLQPWPSGADGPAEVVP